MKKITKQCPDKTSLGKISSGKISSGKISSGKFSSRKFFRQQTLKNAIHCCGTALHSGEKISMTLRPADINTGIVFKRTDVTGHGALIPADWGHVCDTLLCTTLGTEQGNEQAGQGNEQAGQGNGQAGQGNGQAGQGNGQAGKRASVATVEHLMAALAGCGVDNAVIEINGGEVPAMDGSSAPFVFLIECAGLTTQNARRRAIRVLKSVSVHDGDKSASLHPAETFSASFEIDFESAAVSKQAYAFELCNGSFKSEISRARTFGFLHEVDQLRAAGLALGGSLDNAVVISGDQILNEDGLRYDDEFVRHKILDTLGDLYLAGGQIIGAFHGVHSGHAMNNALLTELFADEQAWCYCDVKVPSAKAHKAGRKTKKSPTLADTPQPAAAMA